MKVQVVIGANYGDEGKGLVSGCLSREASLSGESVLTIFYNGTSQRAHTFENEVHRCMAAGTKYGSDTFYHEQFVVDPISIYITQAKPIIDPNCRVILPCDVIANRKKEAGRGKDRHGSCGFGLFEAVKRSRDPEYDIRIKDIANRYNHYTFLKLQKIQKKFGAFDDEIYNDDFFSIACSYILKHCRIRTLPQVLSEWHYDRVIFEGGQGLLLDQRNTGDYPHLTPSSPGSYYISDTIDNIMHCNDVELFYVSRSYMTRHGAGPMEMECRKEDICEAIEDKTNQKNEFQGDLRFGKLNTDSLYDRVKKDVSLYKKVKPKVNMVFTQLNYTRGKLMTTEGPKFIQVPGFINGIYESDQKDYMSIH